MQSIQRQKAERYAAAISAMGDLVIGLYEARTDAERAAFHAMLSSLGVSAQEAGENIRRAMSMISAS